jgi:orotate phosphoribosyltransferase
LLLVDDVSSEAKILTDSIKNARNAGFIIDTVFTIVDRKEGNAGNRLAQQNVTLHSCRRYSDTELAELVRQWKLDSHRN